METKSWHADAVKLHVVNGKSVRQTAEQLELPKSTVGDFLKWYKETFGGDGKSAKVLIFDIETTPMLSWHWRRWQQNIYQPQVVRESILLSWSAKWLGDDKVMYSDTRGSIKEWDDFECAESLWQLINQADAVVAHNGDRFDLKFMNSRWLVNGLPEPHPYRPIDTLKILKRKFGFSSNRLNDIMEMLELGEKRAHEGFPLWIKCINGDIAAFEEMRKYNIHDVELLEEAYLLLRGWDHLHPNLAMFHEERKESEFICPVCQSQDTEPTGLYRTTQRGKYATHRCKNCGKVSHEASTARSRSQASKTLAPSK